MSYILPIFSLIIILLVVVVLVLLRIYLFCAWVPSMILSNDGVFKSLKKSMSMIVVRKYGVVLNNCFAMALTMILVNVLLALSSVGIMLVITIPITTVLYGIFSLVVYYDTQGMKYYVDNYNVVIPQKKDHTDEMDDVKYIV